MENNDWIDEYVDWLRENDELYMDGDEIMPGIDDSPVTYEYMLESAKKLNERAEKHKKLGIRTGADIIAHYEKLEAKWQAKLRSAV